MRMRWIALLASCLALGATLIPSLTQASTIAETGNALDITSTSAELNGVVNPSYSDSVWFFEYSTTSDFSANYAVTKPVPVAQPTAVNAVINNLTPNTVYYYRVGLAAQPDTTQAPTYSLGDTAQFTTSSTGKTTTPSGGNGPKFGIGSLTSNSLKVGGKVANVVMHCRGTAGALCTAKVSLTTTAKGKSVSCGKGSFIASAPHTHTVRVHPSSACLALISAAKHNRLRVKFTGVFSTHQSTLSKTVTLVG
jgi:hypothetical protein